MFEQMDRTAIGKARIVPWWERSKTYRNMWHGSIFDQMILKGEDEEEQRVQRLREALLTKPQGKKGYLSIQRARLLTDSYKKTEGEAAILRKAKGFKYICEHIPIPYQEDQLFMGDPSAITPAVEVEPEFMANFLDREVYCEEANATISEIDAIPIRGNEAWILSEGDAQTLKEVIVPYWRGICADNVTQRQLEENYPEVHFKEGYFVGRASYPLAGQALNHTVADYASVLRKGLKGLKREIRVEMDKIDGSDVPSNSELDRVSVYKATLIAADAIIIYANRCADVAEEAAQTEGDVKRKAELLEMARICRKVPEYPAESWWEALQSWQLLHNAIFMCEGGVSHSAGRFDQYMHPYLKKDLDSAKITRKQAQELIECLLIKVRQRHYLLEYRGAKRVQALGSNDKITISGVDSYGQDATNELSFMLLEAHAHCHLDEPVLSFRMHKDTPDGILKAVLEVLRLGTGIPHILNDTAIIPSLMNRGVPLKEARNYADIGCQENVTDPNTCGADTNPHSNAGWFNITKMVELALYDGVDKLSGEQAGPSSGDARHFKNKEDFFEAVKTQLEYAVHVNCIYNNVLDWTFANWHPLPVLDLLHPGPRKTGLDYEDGGCKHNWFGAIGVGLGTAADSLAAIELLIYDRKEITMDELLKALDNNWKGFEHVRKQCRAAPKYGNDDDYADKWAVRLSSAWMDEYEKHRSAHGGIFVGGFFSMTTYVFIGSETWATPDGRGVSDPLSDAMSPSTGVALEGPTRLHKSGAKIDTWRTTNGVLFNCKFTTGAVAGERELSKWADLVRTYVLLQGQSIQYTIVDNAALKEAQKHPEDYRDLIVRTGGYSAFFVELDKETQDSIIARVEYQV
jgi:formate C-acetyltransferase|tara:strand:+ start:388 stop:2961 length:2574 start_codon:yes stop_codon:yes gene_type:complete